MRFNKVKVKTMKDQTIQQVRIDKDLEIIYDALKESVIVYALFKNQADLIEAMQPEKILVDA
jgi:hypothetical protein